MTSPESRYFERLLHKSHLRIAGNVLDVGCGNGRFARVLARYAERVHGVDVAPNAEWSDDSRVRFSVANAESLPFEDGTFDTVLAMNMLHHTEHPEKALGEIIRVCKPAGSIIVIEPNRWNPMGYLHLTVLGGHQHFSTARFLRMMRNALPRIDTRQFECHCYPLKDPWLRILERIEDVLDHVPLWRPFLFYNVAVAPRPE